ncbi:MAG: YdcF family protein, partial [Candidatus Rokubacteria bacterium]|nr:YdcF family protein [Candidatus Rokubacteria bacterium]
MTPPGHRRHQAPYKGGLAPLIVFSGAAFEGRPAEAEVAARLARELGVPSERIMTETGARTTREEAARIARRLEPRAVRRVLLVTDSEHLTRALPLFERVGLEVLPAPADSVSSATDSPEERLKLLRRLSQELLARL